MAKYFTRLSPKFTCFVALFIESLCYILFGLLIWLPNGWPFICLSFLLRIIGGITSSFFSIASFCIAVQEFPQRPVQAISFILTNFGLGLVSGPTLGGLLYQFGGYITPFIGLGGLLMIGSLLVIVLYPEAMDKTLPKKSSFWHFIADTERLLEALTIAQSFNIIGFNEVTLEPHLRQFK